MASLAGSLSADTNVNNCERVNSSPSSRHQSLIQLTSCETASGNVSCHEIPIYQRSSLYLFCHYCPVKRSNKITTTWSELYKVIHCRHQEYSIVAQDTGIVVNKVHSGFLRHCVPLRQELEGVFRGLAPKGRQR